MEQDFCHKNVDKDIDGRSDRSTPSNSETVSLVIQPCVLARGHCAIDIVVMGTVANGTGRQEPVGSGRRRGSRQA